MSCLDTGHVALGRAWRRFAEVCDGRVAHVHASDNHGQYDDHLVPGEGGIDWSEIVSTLEAMRFGGWMMLELRCPCGEPGSHFRWALARAADIVRSSRT